MDLSQFLPFLLFLHVMGAILAFGPTFAYSIMGAMAGREPQHANFSARQVAAIGNKLVYPLAIFQGVTGVLLIMASGRDLASAAERWLGIAIVLYAITLIYALTVQRNALHHLIEMTSTPPAPGSPPNPEIPATVKKIQRGGMFLGAMIVIIVFLMVVKPTF
jgi:uncharacterized membrane protein